MIGRSSEADEVDAVARIEGARGALTDEGGRHRRFAAGLRAFLAFVLVVALAIGAVLLWKGHERANAQQAEAAKAAKIENKLKPFHPYRPVEPAAVNGSEAAPAAPLAPLSRPTTTDGKQQKTPEELLRDRRLAGGFTAGTESDNAALPSTTGTIHPLASTGDSPLENQLKPLKLKPSVAGLLADRNFLLTRGAMIDCGQQSRLVTDQPGMVTCYTTADTYSANGHVVLIDAGSKLVGSYQTGIVQGQDRVFVAWQRIETRQGVIIDLDSPGTDALGAAGEPGQVDSHWWARFGGAIMLSLISDAGQTLIDQAQSGSTTTINLGNTSQSSNTMSAEALRATINIPPTLYKNQGERVNVFVARDLDFSGVYSLE